MVFRRQNHIIFIFKTMSHDLFVQMPYHPRLKNFDLKQHCVTVLRQRFFYYHTEVLKGSLLLLNRITVRYISMNGISGRFDCPV